MFISDTNGTAKADIINDDTGTLQFSSMNSSGNEVSGQLTFNVELRHQDGLMTTSSLPITLEYRTIDQTAKDGGTGVGDNDYDGAATATQITLDAHQSSWQMPVTINDDAVVELDESFQFEVVSIPSEAPITWAGPTVATGTVLHDDGTAQISIADVSVTEPSNAASVVVSFIVTSNKAVDSDINIGFTNVDGTATSTWTDQDYFVITASPLTVPVGSQTLGVPIQVRVFDDQETESTESFQVILQTIGAGGRSVAFADDTGLGTIYDND